MGPSMTVSSSLLMFWDPEIMEKNKMFKNLFFGGKKKSVCVCVVCSCVFWGVFLISSRDVFFPSKKRSFYSMDLIGLAQFKTFKYHPVFEPFPHESLKPRLFGYGFYWSVVEPTHLKNIKSQWESSPNRDENKKLFETTTQFKEVPHPVGNKRGWTWHSYDWDASNLT